MSIDDIPRDEMIARAQRHRRQAWRPVPSHATREATLMSSHEGDAMSTIEKLTEIRANGERYHSFEYADLLRARGLIVVVEETFGRYQGDLLFHLRDTEGRDGLLIQGYGSCSGCDALEAAQPWSDDGDLTDVAALSDSMAGEIVWADEGGLLAALEAKLADKANWWAYSEGEAIEMARELARKADSAA